MAQHRRDLPQLSGGIFLTDGGLETTLIFHDGRELPEFAAFVLLDDEGGRARLGDYFRSYMAIAQRAGHGFIAEAPTWRANRDWGAKVGYDPSGLDRVNRDAIDLLVELRDEYDGPFVISGNLGPRDDGYKPSSLMTPDEAEHYHTAQIATFAETEADMVSAFTMTHSGEAIGITRAARARRLPVVISFTVETNGALPSGMPLGEAVTEVDEATNDGPAYYMINCAHPTHFKPTLEGGESWVTRIRAVRANASRMSHAELDEAEELDAGDPDEFGALHAELRSRLGHVSVLGGCCGTDDRHVAAISAACAG